MNKKILLFIISFIIVILLIIIGFSKSKKELDIVLKTNGGVPYEWKYSLSNDNIKLVKQYSKVKNKDKELAGGPVEIHYVFKGVKKGETKITFKYVNFVNNTESKKNIYKVKVDKNMNISYVEE